MLTASDLIAEIERYERRETLSPQDCVQLAAYYTLLSTPSLEPSESKPIEHTQYSFTYNGALAAPAQKTPETVSVNGDSEFLRAVDGRKADKVWKLMDELVEAVKILHPRMYTTFIDKVQDL